MSNYILFDLDGTLIDGVDDLVAAANSVLGQHDLPPLQRTELEPMLGDGIRVLTRRAFAARGVQLSGDDDNRACDAFMQAYRDTQYAQTRLYAGVEETLWTLRRHGWRIGLASNKHTAPCEAILTRLGVRPLFDTVAGGDAAAVKKPDGGHLRHALAQMGFQDAAGHHAVMVGDHANDVLAARAAGLAAIAVAFEVDDTRARSLGADAVITRFPALPGVLAQLAAVR